MTERCQIRHMKHSKQKTNEWEIEKEKIEECILIGAKRIEKDSFLGDKIISLYKGIEVAFLKRPCNFVIVTVYYKMR
jgi:hypothetical protein